MKKKIYLACLICFFFMFLGNIYATEDVNQTENDISSESLQTEDIDMYYKDGTQFKANVTGNFEKNDNVTFTINGVDYKREINDSGIAKIKINLNPGDYKIISKYKTSINENNIHIKNVNTSIESVDNLNLTYKNGKYSATLKGGDNKPLSNFPIMFTINGVSYTRTTDINGQASLNINLNYGTYLIHTQFNGQGFYKASSRVSGFIHVVDAKYQLETNDIIIGYTSGRYTVNITDENKNPIKGFNVDFTINGRTYTRTSDDKGQAGLNINLIPGTYTIYYKFRDIQGSNQIIVEPMNYTIQSVNITGSYGDYNFYELYLSKNNESIIDKTIKTEILKDNKVIDTIYSKTFENGVAKFLITLDPGIYTFRSTCQETFYKEIYTENTVNITKGDVVSTTHDLDLNRKGEYYEVALKCNSTDLPIVNETVKININGITYLKTTNKDGVAKLRINLENGEYLVNYDFSEKKGYNNINGTNKIFISNKQLNTGIEIKTKEITRKGTALEIRLTDENDIGLKEEKIAILINGITYYRTTNNEGIAKININLDNGNYPINIEYDGNNLFNSKSYDFLLNVSRNNDFSYAFNISTVQKNNFSIIRQVTVEANNNFYKFTNYNIDGTKNLIYDKDSYFISFDYKNLQKVPINSEITSQGVLLKNQNNNIEVTYLGKLKDVTQFNVVIEDYGEEFYGKKVTLYLNNKIEAVIYFSEYYYTYDMLDYIMNNGGSLYYETETLQTVLSAYGLIHDRVTTIDYTNKNKTIESYVMTDSGVNQEKIRESLINYVNPTGDYDKNALENNLISSYVIWTLKESSDALAYKLNCTWNSKFIVQTMSDWMGTRIHSLYDLDVKGSENNTKLFKNTWGFLFSECERLALESAGIEAVSATTEIFESEIVIFDQKDGMLTITAPNSTSEIKVNLTSGVTDCLLGINMGQILDFYKYKGARSLNFLNFKFPKSFTNSYNLIKKSFVNHYNNIFNGEVSKSIQKAISNEVRTNTKDIISGIGSLVTSISPEVGGPFTASIAAMITIGEKSVEFRDKYAPDCTYQYFSYHIPSYKGKTITVRDVKTGYADYVEIPYTSTGDYDMDKAIYIEGESGKRILTAEEREYYAHLK